MADILLTHSNHLYSDRKQVQKMQPYPPLQTLIAAAMLREQGYDVALFDVTLSAAPDEEFLAAVEKHRPKMVAIVEDNFNFLTKMCLMRNRELAFRMCAVAKAKGVAAVANGADASDRPAEYLAAGFDCVIAGEPERALSEVAAAWVCEANHEALLKNGTARSVHGPGARTNQYPGSGTEKAVPVVHQRPEERRAGPREIARIERRAPVLELDELPDAAWDLVDLESYRQAWKQAHGYFSLNLVSSRGCPYRCNWCAKPVFGSGYRFRSPKRVAAEMLRLKRDFGAEHVWFADDIFALSRSWTLAFCEAIGEAGAALRFKMQSRCDLMTHEIVAALERAGCAEVWMGAESGSQKILDAMEKGTRVEQIYQARENLRRHGIRACFFLQFGYPGETREDIDKTVRMVRETQPDDIGVSVSYPLPGTKFYDRVVSELGEQTNWAESGDLSMLFQGAFSTEFYRELARSLHAEVRGGVSS